jgi:glutathione S-transferase
MQYPIWIGASTVIDAEAKSKLYEAFEWLDSYLEQNDWFVGETVTIADLSILATLSTAVVS